MKNKKKGEEITKKYWTGINIEKGNEKDENFLSLKFKKLKITSFLLFLIMKNIYIYMHNLNSKKLFCSFMKLNL